MNSIKEPYIIDVPQNGRRIKIDVKEWINAFELLNPCELEKILRNIHDNYCQYYIRDLEVAVKDPDGDHEDTRNDFWQETYFLKLLADQLAECNEV